MTGEERRSLEKRSTHRAFESAVAAALCRRKTKGILWRLRHQRDKGRRGSDRPTVYAPP